MANATQDIQQPFRSENLVISRTLTVATGVTIYEGTLVGLNGSGQAIVAVTTSKVAGVAQQKATAGEIVTVYYNDVARISLSGVTAANIGSTAYAADNQTATLSSNTAILGPIVDVGTDEAYIQLTLRA